MLVSSWKAFPYTLCTFSDDWSVLGWRSYARWASRLPIFHSSWRRCMKLCWTMLFHVPLGSGAKTWLGLLCREYLSWWQKHGSTEVNLNRCSVLCSWGDVAVATSLGLQRELCLRWWSQQAEDLPRVKPSPFEHVTFKQRWEIDSKGD